MDLVLSLDFLFHSVDLIMGKWQNMMHPTEKQFAILDVFLFNPKHMKRQNWLNDFPLLKGYEKSVIFNLNVIDSFSPDILLLGNVKLDT